ncbi:MAG TPA: EVE domain-containing protein [Parvibaculum sp.]|uniref:EVE domain-containing protein n=1 Tax=Parvibaculum sp. TaxID=2024848 RepID=UPI002B6263DB|nr:EVE domain-containing protein [Parvibaculum sp.]HMM14914.1 EVE domain-containing protein [Parvibaculum sp.]
MAYWLFKSEPSAWSWDDQKKKGAKGEPWNGVRNYQANNNMKAMKKGDLGFFYHSVDEKRIVGIVRVIGEHRPDPTDETGRFGLVLVEAVCDLPKPVTLADIKAEPRLAEMAILKQSRLSVPPVRDEEWKLICKMGGLAKAP